MNFADKWMESEKILLSEITQKQKDNLSLSLSLSLSNLIYFTYSLFIPLTVPSQSPSSTILTLFPLLFSYEQVSVPMSISLTWHFKSLQA
jgi:hypothetical protein